MQIKPPFFLSITRRWIAPSAAKFVRGILLAAVWLAAIAQAAPTGAADIVIVRTSDAEPYTQAESALRQQLSGGPYRIKSMLARDASDKGIEQSIGKPDAVVAIGTASARWLHKKLPADVKLIYCMVSNFTDTAAPSDHICVGVTTDIALPDQIKLVAEALPRVRNIGFMYRSDTADGRAALVELQAALPAGWNVRAVAANDFPSVAAAIDSLMQKQIDLAWTMADPKLYDTACVRSLLLASVRNHIPVWGYSLAFVRAGALLGVGVEPAAQGRQAAELVVQAVGHPASFTTRMFPPREFQIGVNEIVAEQIGVEIPDSVLRRAAQVYRQEK